MSSHHCSLTLDLMTGRHILTFPRPAALQQFGCPLATMTGLLWSHMLHCSQWGAFLPLDAIFSVHKCFRKKFAATSTTVPVYNKLAFQ